jgi:adenosine 3'-phospho 5'-phosphosulfate transporter B3
MRSFTFYFGAFFFTELTRHSGATKATAVATARKGMTVMASFALFPGDKVGGAR